MSGFWRKRLRNRLALLRYGPAAEWQFRRLQRQGLFQPIDQLQTRFGARIPSSYPGAKYLLRHRLYLRENIVRGLQLGLLAGPPRRLLDLGCGPGYFLLLCRHWGHEILGVDLPGNQIFDRLSADLAVPRRSLAVRAGEPLPADLGQFDLITAYSIDFDEDPATGRSWSVAEWAFFLRDVSRFLPAGGQLCLRLNLDKYGLQRLIDQTDLWQTLTQAPAFQLRRHDHRDLLLVRQIDPATC